MNEATLSSDAAASESLPWKNRVEEPANRFVYYPIARLLVRGLLKTPITANQVTMIQPLIAAYAGWLISHEDPRTMLLGALVFEFRSMLDCADGTLARAKKSASSNGHAIDAFCDWLSVVCLYAGIYAHFTSHPPPAGAWSAYLPMGAVMTLSLLQGAGRSMAGDYYMRKYGSIFATGRDETVEDLRDKVRALNPSSSFFSKFEAWIGRYQYLCFEQESFDPEATRQLTAEQAGALVAQQRQPVMRWLAGLWSISNGDFFIRMSVLSVALGHRWMWELQLFWASAGWLWLLGVLMLNAWFIRRTIDSGHAEANA